MFGRHRKVKSYNNFYSYNQMAIIPDFKFINI